MLRDREVALQADAEKRFKALWRAALEGNYPPPGFAPGVSQDGRYGYRYDDEGRLWAAPIAPGSWPKYLS